MDLRLHAITNPELTISWEVGIDNTATTPFYMLLRMTIRTPAPASTRLWSQSPVPRVRDGEREEEL